MRIRSLSACLAAGLLALAWSADPAAAQRGANDADTALEGQQEKSQRPAAVPLRPDRGQRLDGLFAALKAAPSERAATAIAGRIEAMMLQSGSDTADLLMTRARGVMEAKEYDLSLELLDAVIELSPDYTEAYAQRATVLYLKKDLVSALGDLRVVIAREPRHFTALAGLGVILRDIGRDKLALDAFRRAVALHPHLKGIPQLIQRLEVQVEGRDI